MPKLPEPPGTDELRAIGARPEERVVLAAGGLLWRLYFQGGPHPSVWNRARTWGPTDARFDPQLPPPGPSDRGVLYVAALGRTCLAEVFQSTRVVDRRRRRPWLVAFELARDLRLLDLGGRWPTRAGASQAISSGPRPRAQRWSQRLWAALPDLDGLAYPSSMSGGETAYALYERAADALPQSPTFHRPLTDPGLLVPLEVAADELGYTIV